MDNLERDMRMAEKLGYGCHYGQYKAEHPKTADLTDEEILGLPVKRKRKPAKTGPDMTACLWCGKSFLTNSYGKQYCNDDCRRYAYEAKRREQKGKVIKDKRCPVCGKPVVGIRNRKCCSAECQDVSDREQYQFKLARAKMQRAAKKLEGL